MTTIVEFSVDPAAFVLPDYAADPSNDAELVPLAASDGPVSRLLRTNGTDGATDRVALEADPTVADATLISDLFDGARFRVQWAAPGPLVSFLDDRLDAAVEKATLSAGRWSLRVHVPPHSDPSNLLSFEAEVNVTADLTVDRIYTPDAADQAAVALSEPQYEAVRLALDAGYYEFPRESTTSDLAETFDISQQALSERLRRAHGRLAEDAMSVDSSDNGRSGGH